MDVLGSLGPVVAKSPELVRQKIIQRVCEPERQFLGFEQIFKNALVGSAHRRPRSRCNRTPAATRGRSTTPRAVSPRSWPTIHATCLRVADEYGSPGNHVAGATIAGVPRVASAMLDQGLI